MMEAFTESAFFDDQLFMAMCMMGLLFIQMEKMEYFKINEVPSTPQLAELIKILLPQKIRTIIQCSAGQHVVSYCS